MQSPNFAPLEYLNASAVNSAFALVSGNSNTSLYSTFSPGLLFPEQVALTVSGLSVTAVCPAPFGIAWSNGVISQAHGTQTNQNTNTYSVSFSGLVPASGTILVFLYAAYAQIQQSPYQVNGPPVGNPDYSPNNVPTTAYAANIDSFSMGSTSGGLPGGAIGLSAGQVEIARFLLSAGATGLPSPNLAYQTRAGSYGNDRVVDANGTPSLSLSNAGSHVFFIIPAPSGVTLPAVSGANGVNYSFTASSGVTGQVFSNGNDPILGSSQNPSVPVTSFTVQPGCSYFVEGIRGAWFIKNISQVGMPVLTQNLNIYVSPTGSDLNNGLSPATPFQTLQRAFNYVQQGYNLGGFQVICNLANGTYQGFTATGPLVGQLGAQVNYGIGGGVGSEIPAQSQLGAFIINGNASNPSAVVLTTSGGLANYFVVRSCIGSSVAMQNCTLTSSATGANGTTGILVDPGSQFVVGQGVNFGSFPTGEFSFHCSVNGTLFFAGNYTISGGALAHIFTCGSGARAMYLPIQCQITTSINFGFFLLVSENSTVDAEAVQFVNQNLVTGEAYNIQLNGVVNTNGKNRNTWFPGFGGSITTGGQFG